MFRWRINKYLIADIVRSSHPEVFLIKDVLKICSKFTGEHPYRSVHSCLATLFRSHFGMRKNILLFNHIALHMPEYSNLTGSFLPLLRGNCSKWSWHTKDYPCCVMKIRNLTRNYQMILLHSNISIISGDKLLSSKEASTAESMKKYYFSHT